MRLRAYFEPNTSLDTIQYLFAIFLLEDANELWLNRIYVSQCSRKNLHFISI